MEVVRCENVKQGNAKQSLQLYLTRGEEISTKLARRFVLGRF